MIYNQKRTLKINNFNKLNIFKILFNYLHLFINNILIYIFSYYLYFNLQFYYYFFYYGSSSVTPFCLIFLALSTWTNLKCQGS